ncbi:phage tail tape measure protein, partial [Patescibacteria group bacterium]|nr:phage tail tape measure protein [Patescibacteria group bacterium]
MAGAAFDAGSILARLMMETNDWDKQVAKVSKDQKGMDKDAKTSSKGFQSFGTNMTSMAKKMAIGLGLGLGVAGAMRILKGTVTDIIKTGVEFGRQWANVTTMIDTSTVNTESLKKELIALSPTLGGTTEMAKAMYQVLSASIEPAKAVEFLGEAAKAAKAGVTSVFTAVDALTTVINAYGMEAEDVTDISDIMFQTVKRGKLTFEGLSGALGTIAPVAGTAGVKFEEISAAIATLTRSGIDVNTATMQLRQILMAILKPSDQAAAKAEELGIEFSGQALKAKGLAAILAEIKDKTDGDSSAMAELVPNVRALTGVMTLAGRGADGFSKDLKLMAEASGSAEEAFQKQTKEIGFWIDTAKSSFEKFKISFFDGFIEPFKDGLKTSDDLDKKVGQTGEALNVLGGAVGTVADALVN